MELPEEWKAFPNLDEYLLRLNRLLTALPGKLSRLFPRTNLMLKNLWNQADRLKPDEFLAAVYRYEKLDFYQDIEVLSNIRLDPDFNYFLNDKSVNINRIKDQLNEIQNCIDYLYLCQVYTSDIDINEVEADKAAIWNVIFSISSFLDWLVDLKQMLQSSLFRLQPPESLQIQSSQSSSNLAEFILSLPEDSEVKQRLKNIGEWNKTHFAKMDEVIARWQKWLAEELKPIPYEDYAQRFEYACCNVLDEFKSKYHSGHIAEFTDVPMAEFIEAIKDTAARIVVQSEKDMAQRRTRIEQEILSTIEAPAPQPKKLVLEPYTEAQKEELVQFILAPLGGLNPQKQFIMNRKDFERLITYTNHLVRTDSLPNPILPIKQTGISNEHIRYTYYRLHKQLFGTKYKRPSFIEFLHVVFPQFAGTSQTTTNSKFSTPPKSYGRDFAGYIGEPL
ncbi:hypothetical protein [Spirosoma pulveris]